MESKSSSTLMCKSQTHRKGPCELWWQAESSNGSRLSSRKHRGSYVFSSNCPVADVLLLQLLSDSPTPIQNTTSPLKTIKIPLLVKYARTILVQGERNLVRQWYFQDRISKSQQYLETSSATNKPSELFHHESLKTVRHLSAPPHPPQGAGQLLPHLHQGWEWQEGTVGGTSCRG